jgi:hypothetical protein
MPEAGAGVAPMPSSCKILSPRCLPSSGSGPGAGDGLQKTDTPGEGSRKTEVQTPPRAPLSPG